MAKNKEVIQFRDWSKGNIRVVQNSIVPKNSAKLALNFNSDEELGSLVSRLGTNIVGTQTVASGTCLGIHYFRDTVGTSHKLFGVFSDGSNNDVYDMITGNSSLTGDTKDLKTRFCTYLDSVVRVNGTDACKAFNGSTWDTTGGAFDVANMPIGTVVIEWKDRVYTAGVSTSPSIIYYSGIADPDTRAVSWTVANGQIEVEQEDGGGAITALEKVPGYLLIFKERSMKRWDGSSTYPEDLVNVGVATQEAVCRGRNMVFLANQQGVWATNGGYPQKISKPIQDLWDAIPSANLSSIATYSDDNYVYVYVGDITLGDNSYTNICFKYNIDNQTWDIYSYYNDFTCFTWYISSNSKVIVGGDKDGQAIQINTGNTDYNAQPITWSFESNDIEFGTISTRGLIKELSQMNVFTENCITGDVMIRINSHRDKDWKPLGSIKGDIQDLEFKAKGNYFNIKATGTTNSGKVKFLGFEFPAQSINVVSNIKD